MVKPYLEHSREILCSARAEFKANQRTGMGTIALFGYQNHYDLREGFPLLTTKKMPFKTIAHELIWFLHGEHNIKYLVDNNVHIWDDNAFQHQLKKQGLEKKFPMYSEDWFKARAEYIQRIKEDSEFAEEHGDLGPVYGTQWRHWPKYIPLTLETEGKPLEIADKSVQLYLRDPDGMDQLGDLIAEMKKNPTRRRGIVSAWNPAEVRDMALPPCHTMFHLNVNEGNMDLQLYQRSCDMFLGVPFNIASYAMLTHIIAQQLDLVPRTFVHSFGDSHFYAGAGKRAQFYKRNFEKFRRCVSDSNSPIDYQNILGWIDREAPPEEKGKEGQDHVTAILEQLLRTPKKLPRLTIANKALIN